MCVCAPALKGVQRVIVINPCLPQCDSLCLCACVGARVGAWRVC